MFNRFFWVKKSTVGVWKPPFSCQDTPLRGIWSDFDGNPEGIESRGWVIGPDRPSWMLSDIWYATPRVDWTRWAYCRKFSFFNNKPPHKSKSWNKTHKRRIFFFESFILSGLFVGGSFTWTMTCWKIMACAAWYLARRIQIPGNSQTKGVLYTLDS